jgi:hypothetical protein
LRAAKKAQDSDMHISDSYEIDVVERTEKRTNSRTGVLDVNVTWSVRINGEVVHSLSGPTARQGCEHLAAHLRARQAASHLHFPDRTPRTRADGWNPRDGGLPPRA